MREVTLEELLEAGCHFGHQVTRQNPKARDFVFEARDNIHIIDLGKTKEGLEEAAHFVKSLAQKKGTLIVVGTKRQAQGIVQKEVTRAKSQGVSSIYSVSNRWVGGVLTNFSEVQKNLKKLKELSARLTNEEEKSKYTKKEVGLWEKERQKLENLYGGIENLEKVPDALFIIDTHLEHLAVREAIRMGITTVGITDTNSDPTIIDYPIPANDDAVGSIELIVTYLIDAFIEGYKFGEVKKEVTEKKEQEEEHKKPKRKTKKEKSKDSVTDEKS